MWGQFWARWEARGGSENRIVPRETVLLPNSPLSVRLAPKPWTSSQPRRTEARAGIRPPRFADRQQPQQSADHENVSVCGWLLCPRLVVRDAQKNPPFRNPSKNGLAQRVEYLVEKTFLN